MNKSVIIGMSGGVDSSVAAALLVKQAYKVTGVTMKLWEGYTNAGNIAETLGIPYIVADFQKEFNEEVISYFIHEYQSGRTPNPCVMCNKKIKFEALLKKADELGADYISTGHYSHIAEQNGRFLLKRPADRNKDQTYFLYNLTQQQLSRTLMPLSGITKDETRKIAAELKLASAERRDSQEICFIPNGDYAKFITEYGCVSPPGDFVDLDGNVLGRHSGIINYTVGQRKGLGIALGKPVFVAKIDSETNRVFLGEEGCQLSDTLFANDLNFIPFDKPEAPFRCTAKIRYNAKESPCVVQLCNDGVKVTFDAPLRSVTPGQSVVFYDDDVVIGGGTIWK